MLSQFLCLFDRHKPFGRRADWNGETFVSRCAHCNKSIKRVGKHKWRRDVEALD